MRKTATILAVAALGAVMAVGSATDSMARGHGGHGGHGGGHEIFRSHGFHGGHHFGGTSGALDLTIITGETPTIRADSRFSSAAAILTAGSQSAL